MPTSSINWQYFPRSQRPPDHLLAVIEAFKVAENSFLEHDAKWQAWAKSADRSASSRPSMESRDVLRMVAPALEASGYSVERSGAELPVVVLWGPNGTAKKSYKVTLSVNIRLAERLSSKSRLVQVTPTTGGARI